MHFHTRGKNKRSPTTFFPPESTSDLWVCSIWVLAHSKLYSLLFWGLFAVSFVLNVKLISSSSPGCLRGCVEACGCLSHAESHHLHVFTCLPQTTLENKRSRTPFLHIWVHLRRVFPAGSPDSYFKWNKKTKQRHHGERVLLKIRRKWEQAKFVRPSTRSWLLLWNSHRKSWETVTSSSLA